jgi:uncharacterized membrane protein
MFHETISSVGGGEIILEWIEYAALSIEVLAAVIIVAAIFSSVFRYFFRWVTKEDQEAHYQELKNSLGKTLLLGLEILVAADIVRTVALEATFESVMILGLLVLIRTFLSWSLEVELEGRWPWQPPRSDPPTNL